MSRVYKALKNIDYPLLREQKATLLKHIDTHKGAFSNDHLEGILALIDDIQDTVVEDGIKTEEEVFGK